MANAPCGVLFTSVKGHRPRCLWWTSLSHYQNMQPIAAARQDIPPKHIFEGTKDFWGFVYEGSKEETTSWRLGPGGVVRWWGNPRLGIGAPGPALSARGPEGDLPPCQQTSGRKSSTRYQPHCVVFFLFSSQTSPLPEPCS